jgi:hypothetical protein
MNPTAPSSSSSSAPSAVAALERAKTKADVRALLAVRDIEEINAAWRALQPTDRAALSLVRAFDGEVVDIDPAEIWSDLDG